MFHLWLIRRADISCSYKSLTAFFCFCITGWLGLEDGPSELHGRAICFLNNLWGTICDDSYDVYTGWPRTFCVDLGYKATDIAPYAKYTSIGIGTGNIAWKLGSCGRPYGLDKCIGSKTSCNHNKDVVVRCKGQRTLWP